MESGGVLLASVSSTVIAVRVPLAGLSMLRVRDLSGKGFSLLLVLEADYK